MMRLILCALVGASVGSGAFVPDHANLVGPHDLDAGVDCAMRNLTWAYAQHLMPSRAPLVDAFDALRLAEDCNMTRPESAAPPAPFYAASPRRGGSGAPSVLRTLQPAAGAFYADPVGGSDSAAGTEAAPFRTIERALAATRATAGGGGGSIVLRAGTFQQSAPVVLGAADAGLTISAYPGEAPVLSGGASLPPLKWTRVGPAPPLPNSSSPNNATVWSASLAGAAVTLPFNSLFFDGRRATRARYPNGNPEHDIAPVGHTKANKWLASPPFPNDLVQHNPALNTETRSACAPDACTKNGPQGIGPPWAIFCCNFWGYNATAVNFTDGSFWAAQPGPPGGGTAQMPGGLMAGNDTLPRLPAWLAAGDVSNVVVHAFHDAYWGDWSWVLQSVNATDGRTAFSRGGWQEARGSGQGDALYYENIFAELDDAGEWFVNAQAKTLYYVANGTAPPPSDGWVAGQLMNLVSALGSPAAPVEDVVLAGLTFEHTEPTFMEPFTVPSGGDMSYHDGGAVRFAGTRNCSVQGSLFVNLGGSGVAISGFNRDARVEDSEFLWLGEHAVFSMGTTGDVFDNSDGLGVAVGTALRGVLCHEIGLYVKQTGCLYVAMTANASVTENVFFNGPRAGINLNDGFAGGHDISRNVGFNFVRETSDHGVFNSWDRQTYRWRAATSGALGDGVDVLPITMDRNLFICNYRAYFPIDNDDGSNGYVQTNNFLLWGGTKTLMGYNKHFFNNTFVYVDYAPIASTAAKMLGGPPRNGYSSCASSIASYPWREEGLDGKQEQWWNNTCIASSSSSFFNVRRGRDPASHIYTIYPPQSD